jgi:hypothetical protein
MVFVPGEIPRQGMFAHWGRGTGAARLELVFPGAAIWPPLAEVLRLAGPYARSDTEWEPSGPPQADPALAVADL